MKKLQKNEMLGLAAEFLLAFRMASTAALLDAIHPGQNMATPSSGRYTAKLKAHGIISKVATLGTYKTWITGANARGYAMRLGWLPTTNENKVAGVQRQHILTTADIAAQLITGRDTKLLGLNETEWQKARRAILNRQARLIGEKEYDTTWKKLTDDQHKQVYVATYNNPEETALTAYEAARDYDQDLIYTWTLVAQGYAFCVDEKNERRYQNAKRLLGPAKQVPEDEKNKIFLLWDHNPDAVLFIDDDDPRAYAIETELTPKQLSSYVRTLAEYQSPYGLALYRHVTWLCATRAVYRLLQRALAIVGNQGNQIKLVCIKPAKEDEDWYIGTRVVRNQAGEKTRSTRTSLPIADIETTNPNDEDDDAFPLEEEPVDYDEDTEDEDAENDKMPIIETIARSAKTKPSPFDEIKTDTSDFLE